VLFRLPISNFSEFLEFGSSFSILYGVLFYTSFVLELRHFVLLMNLN
jgi:hypothetical protein